MYYECNRKCVYKKKYTQCLANVSNLNYSRFAQKNFAFIEKDNQTSAHRCEFIKVIKFRYNWAKITVSY